MLVQGKVCEICGEVFYRRDNEASGNFNRKKTCSIECSKQLMREKKLLELSPKKCKVCGKEFHRRDDEKVKDFKKRQTCSRECTNKLVSVAYTKYPDNNICEVCGEEFFRRENEKPAVFARRKTCSKECLSILKGNNKITLESKVCSICGKEFSRRDDEKSTDYRNRKTCSKECGFILAGQNERVVTGVKNCIVCGIEFSRRDNESPGEFIKRKTCSKKCSFIIGIHSEESRKKTTQITMERYGVPWYCMTKDCRSSYNNISRPNKYVAERLSNLDINYEYEFSIGSYSYDLRVDGTLIEINPFAFHNATFHPFGSEVNKNYHKDKSSYAKGNGYHCIHIWDWDDVDKVVSLFLPKTTLYARKLSIKEVPQDECREFLQKYHLQNDTKSQPIRIGLYSENELVQVMTFGAPRYNKNYDYELLRLCSRPDIKVVGGAERLLKWFIKQYNGNIISYCDMSKFNGDVYYRLGFSLLKENQPSKHWYNPKDKKHITDMHLRRYGFDKLVGKYYNVNYGKGTSNDDLMVQYGFVEIYDCGQYTFVLNKE